MTVLRITDVRLGLDQQQVDLVIENGRVTAVMASGDPHGPARATLDGRGGIVLPGFADDHLHLGAWLRSRRSVVITADDTCHDAIARLVGTPPRSGGWAVGFGIDHHQEWGLEAVAALTQPALLVHRTGRAAFLNGAGARLLGRPGRPTTIHARGVWSQVLGTAEPREDAAHLADLRNDLLSQGVVAIRDATPYPAGAEGRVAELRRELAPIRLSVMGDPELPVVGAEHVKILDPLAVDRERLAPLDRAVHAIEPYEAVVACDLIGDRQGRIEHAALCPPSLAEMLASRSVTVCANPAFLVERRMALSSMHRSGLDDLFHPIARLAEYQIPHTFGSDAPVTSAGVLAGLRAARGRGSRQVPFRGDRVPIATALAAVTISPDLVEAPSEEWVGRPADLGIWPIELLTDDEFESSALATVVAGKVAWTSASEKEALRL